MTLLSEESEPPFGMKFHIFFSPAIFLRMAPEVKGHKEYSYSADVYSMAIVLYEIFTELPVYDKNSRRVVLQKEFMVSPTDISGNFLTKFGLVSTDC
jgi:serine/threonine protein kinase